MSALDAHAKAARCLADAFEDESDRAPTTTLVVELQHVSRAYRNAADRMEELAREEAVAAGSKCSVDHATMTVARCPACGAGKPR